MQEDVRRLTCMNNLSHHGQAYLVTARRKAPAHCGAALWVSFCKRIAADPRVLVCPADARARRPETAEDRARYEIVDLDHVPRDLCSYPGRDFEKFPIDPKSHDKQPIGACLSHKGGAPVIYADGRVEWLTLEKLGLDSDDDKIVGPDSKSPVLRVLRYGDGSVR
jgi:prepilin-type processing-associated H-X9-DG protein